MPFTWLILLVIGLIFIKQAKIRKRISIAIIILGYIFTNEYLANQCLNYWEYKPTLFSEVPENEYTVGIVLTGYTTSARDLKDRVSLNRSADRLMHTIRLFKENKIRYILICGTESFNQDGSVGNPPVSSRSILKICQVPDSAIIIENQSRNTHENAVNASTILQKRFPNQKHLLVTSASHLRRAEGCFLKVGLKIEPFSADYQGDTLTFQIHKFIPNENAVVKWNVFFKEFFGYIIYKIAGYI
jgi:uncharacterized SAM-binding protein YcdF (DUF218 family)